MPPAQQSLVALRERLPRELLAVPHALSEPQLSAAGGLAVKAAEIQEAAEQQTCAAEIRTFVGQYIPQEMIDKDAGNEHLLEVACSIMAKNWLQPTPETPEDNQAMADILLAIFTAVPARSLPRAAITLGSLRSEFGPKDRYMDTTGRLLKILRGISKPEPMMFDKVESRLKKYQIEQLAKVMFKPKQPQIAPPHAKFINGVLVYVRD